MKPQGQNVRHTAVSDLILTCSFKNWSYSDQESDGCNRCTQRGSTTYLSLSHSLFSLSVSHSHSLSFHSHSLSLSLSLSLFSLSLTLTLYLSFLSLSLSLTLYLSLSLSLSFLSLSLCLSLSLYLSLSLSFSLSLSLMITHKHTHTHTLSLSPFLWHPWYIVNAEREGFDVNHKLIDDDPVRTLPFRRSGYWSEVWGCFRGKRRKRCTWFNLPYY